MHATQELEKEEIKKQIDAIIRLMEDQIETAKEKQAMIDSLITSTEQASKQITKMQEESAELASASDARSSKTRLLLLGCGVSVGSVLLLVYALR
ncbi:hypothetical protein NECID01_0805 [Nematocida sp. AWRm77]|nr:hypothetical protein NECID01_0805 [Nematocida sp. AWRm77]